MVRRSERSGRSPWHRIIRWLVPAVLILVIVCFRLVERIGLDRHAEDQYVVMRIIDGDTVELLEGDLVRLLSIDTPEQGEPLSDEALYLLEDLVQGKRARLEFAGRRRDKYGRLLAYVYVDSIFVNRAILERGLGWLYLFEDTDLDRLQTAELLEAQRGAMQAGLGLWSLPRYPEVNYVAVEGSLRFHRPHCRYVRSKAHRHLRRFDRREEALWEGLSPCRTCKP